MEIVLNLTALGAGLTSSAWRDSGCRCWLLNPPSELQGVAQRSVRPLDPLPVTHVLPAIF